MKSTIYLGKYDQTKKSCIVHGCAPEDCAHHYGCPDEVSQADVRRTETIMDHVPTFLGMVPDGYEGTAEDKGIFLWVRETTRAYSPAFRSYVCTTRNVSFARIALKSVPA